MDATIYRGCCHDCGWIGRRLTSESAAQFAAGKHARRTGHNANLQPMVTR